VPGGTHGEDEATAAIYRRAVEEWGFDYLMLDFNSTDCDNADPTRTVAEVVRDRFRAVRAAAGARVLIEACMAPLGPVIGAVDGFRPATDFRGGEEDAMLPDFASCAPLHGSIVQLDSEFYDASIRRSCGARRPSSPPGKGSVRGSRCARSWDSPSSREGTSPAPPRSGYTSSAERCRCWAPARGAPT